MTTAQNNIIAHPGGFSKILPYQIDSSGSNDINQGDLVYFNTTSKFVISVASDANAATLAGVSTLTSFIDPYGLKQYLSPIMVAFDVIAALKTTSGDTYNWGDAVYIGADAQTITNVAATNKVGFVYPQSVPVIGTAFTIAGGSGVTAPILVIAQFPELAI